MYCRLYVIYDSTLIYLIILTRRDHMYCSLYVVYDNNTLSYYINMYRSYVL